MKKGITQAVSGHNTVLVCFILFYRFQALSLITLL